MRSRRRTLALLGSRARKDRGVPSAAREDCCTGSSSRWPPRTLASRSRAEAHLTDESARTSRSGWAGYDSRSPIGPWTRANAATRIAARPETRAGDLAADLGQERLPFKANVRKLKALGLTESLPVGYRLPASSPALVGPPFPRPTHT